MRSRYAFSYPPHTQSVNRVTYIFNYSVELFWLIGVHVVRGFVYQLQNTKDIDRKIMTTVGICNMYSQSVSKLKKITLN